MLQKGNPTRPNNGITEKIQIGRQGDSMSLKQFTLALEDVLKHIEYKSLLKIQRKHQQRISLQQNYRLTNYMTNEKDETEHMTIGEKNVQKKQQIAYTWNSK